MSNNGNKDLRSELYITHASENFAIIKSSVVIPKKVLSVTPEFRWQNAYETQGDTVTYELQVADNIDFVGGNVVVFENIAENPVGITSQRLVVPLTKEVVYNWRVRAYDGYEYGSWSQTLAVICTDNWFVDLMAKIAVMPYVNLPARVFLTMPFTDLPCCCYVDVSNQCLNSVVLITRSSYVSLSSSVNVDVLAQTLPSSVLVIKSGYTDLYSAIDVDISEQVLMASIVIYKEMTITLSASVTITCVNQSLPSAIVVEREGHADFDCLIYIKLNGYGDLPSVLRIAQYGDEFLFAKISILPKADLMACIGIGKNADLMACVGVGKNADLMACVFIWKTVDLPAKLVVNKPSYIDLGSCLVVRHFSDLMFAITIFNGSSVLPSEIMVDVDMQVLPAQISIIRMGESDLSAQITVMSEFVELFAGVTVVRVGDSGLSSRVFVDVFFQRLSACVNISVYDFILLPSVIVTIADRPNNVGEIVVKNLLNEIIDVSVWQSENELMLEWGEAYDRLYGVSYYVAVNQEEDYNVGVMDINLGDQCSYYKKLPYAGVWYFHVIAINDIGNSSTQKTTLILLYNNKPGKPVEPLMFNGMPSKSYGNVLNRRVVI